TRATSRRRATSSSNSMPTAPTTCCEPTRAAPPQEVLNLPSVLFANVVLQANCIRTFGGFDLPVRHERAFHSPAHSVSQDSKTPACVEIHSLSEPLVRLDCVA